MNSLQKNIFVIFGANGDLTARKLIPALSRLYSCDYLNFDFTILGISRTEYSDDSFRDYLTERVNKESAIDTSSDAWKAFIPKVHYLSMNVKDKENFKQLSSFISDHESADEKANCLYYLATSPSLYEDIVNNLSANNLIASPDQEHRTDVIIEKPIGQDYESAKELSCIFSSHLKESQIYRIDHYLGKETVQNILMFRFANAIFESIWNKHFIDHIQISVAEEIGVESRVGYYDQAGTLRDMVQNHLMQILSLLCIEPPVSLGDPSAIHNEKVKVMRSIMHFNDQTLHNNVVRGQYQSGTVNSKEVPGFLDLDGVSPNSETETYVAMKLGIDSWRWAGVPILLRTGKRLKKRVSEVTVFFKSAPKYVAKSLGIERLKTNVLAIQIQPNEGISVQFNTKLPGLEMQAKPVIMDFTYNESFDSPGFDAYERLLLDVFKGDQTLFIRDDEVLESWKLLTPVLESWKNPEVAPKLLGYQAGSWGPEDANKLTDGLEYGWRKFK